MASNNNWISQKVQGVVAGAGNAVAGAYTSVGNGVSGAGRGAGNVVTGTTRGWADGIRSYGNAIKDASGASGPRAPTASNPLGIAGAKGTRAITGGGASGPRKGTANNPLGL
ncbi:hypothetical protein BT63DRAFT_419851 [Microthyrium microscopicum]|uniref:Uncharacterized protein n=1 Tax=Microthyrium microscopicum TaxID=703497 RepID=A0A6A6UUF6_9PEZI|nr:hypothetical protein BT63DRAFT_419851 [Microthyrium microscopicum]